MADRTGAWSGVLVGLLAAMLSAACDKKSQPTEESPVGASASGVSVTVGEHGFTPASVTLPKGPSGTTSPVTFLRTTDQTCAKEVVFPDLGIKKDLPLRAPVTVDIPADAARTLTFQCGMAMYKGALVVR
jgi:plastocyanin domain-containing protein